MSATTLIGSAMTTVRGVRTRYLHAGEGPPIVLLHGAGDSAIDWTWVLPALADGHRVYAPDLLGQGDTDKPRIRYTPEALVAFVQSFLDRLGIERAALVGHSAGGLAATLLALTQRERVSSLTLVDSAGLGRFISPALSVQALPGIGEMITLLGPMPVSARQLAWLRARLLFSRLDRVPPSWIQEQIRLMEQPGFLRATISALRADITLGVQHTVLLDQLPRLSMPVHLIWGEHDPIVPPTHAERALHHLSHGSLSLIPGAGHVPHIERPEAFIAAARPFLDLHGAPSVVAAERLPGRA